MIGITWVNPQSEEKPAVVADLLKLGLASGISQVVSWASCCSCSPAMLLMVYITQVQGVDIPLPSGGVLETA